MFWEGCIIVLSLAAAISAGDSDVPQGKSGMDATGSLIIKTEPIRGLDTAGVPINDTELLRISGEEIDFHNGNSIEERKGCSPSISCTRAGGYCIKGRAKCDGAVDTQGCRGGKRCKCCIPDQTTSAHPTCPTTQPICTCPSVTPCPTVEVTATTDIPTTTVVPTTTDIPTTTVVTTTTDIPTTTVDTTTTDTPTTTVVTTTTDIPTTTVVTTTTNIPTTPGPTVNPNLSWLSVGSDRFVRFPQEMNWFAARSLCQANGLDLFEPTNIQAVAIYLEDNFSDRWYWIGSRGNGTHVVWLSGGVIPRSAPWHSNKYLNVGTDQCTEMVTWSGESRAGNILAPVDCTARTNIDVLCG